MATANDAQLAKYQSILTEVQKQHNQHLQHAMDAALYGLGAQAAIPKPMTPRQKAMMGIYNHKSPDEDFYIRLLGMRLRVKDGEMIPFDHITCYHDMASGDVHLIVIKNNQAVTMQESGAIFPSDEVIAQLHMIINK